jgi:hypothetical protein
MQHLTALRGHLTVNPRTFIATDDLVLVLGTFTLSGSRGDGTPLSVRRGSPICCAASRTAVGSEPSTTPTVMTDSKLPNDAAGSGKRRQTWAYAFDPLLAVVSMVMPGSMISVRSTLNPAMPRTFST